jgi:hypothetical protein
MEATPVVLKTGTVVEVEQEPEQPVRLQQISLELELRAVPEALEFRVRSLRILLSGMDPVEAVEVPPLPT